MRHFVLSLRKEDPAPVGLGDAPSWFRFYKLEAEDTTQIPRVPGLEGVTAGDALWICLEDKLLGYVTILHVDRDEINDRDELWFDPRLLRKVKGDHQVFLGTIPITDDTARKWLSWIEST